MSWQQGRTAFGGLTTALGMTAAYRELLKTSPSSLPCLRSMSVSFVAPVKGTTPLATEVTVLRSGSSVTHVRVDVTQAEQLTVAIHAVFGATRSVSKTLSPKLIEVPSNPPHSAERLKADFSQLPQFLGHWDPRFVEGNPLTGRDRDLKCSTKRKDRMKLWLRLQEGLPADVDNIVLPDLFNAVRVIAAIDMPPPGVFLHYFPDRPRASSVSWMVEFTKDPATVADEWLFIDSQLLSASSGYSHQDMRLSCSKGELIQ